MFFFLNPPGLFNISSICMIVGHAVEPRHFIKEFCSKKTNAPFPPHILAVISPCSVGKSYKPLLHPCSDLVWADLVHAVTGTMSSCGQYTWHDGKPAMAVMVSSYSPSVSFSMKIFEP